MADADTVKLNAEEQAAMDRAKEALEKNKAIIGTPLPMYDPMWLLTPPGMEVMKSSLGRDPETREPYPVVDGTVTAVIPRTVTLTLDHHHRVELVQGIREVPAALMAHPWLRANGIVPYEKGRVAPTPPPPVLLGATLDDPVRVGDRHMPLGPWVVQAQADSGMTPEAWNALTAEERTKLVQDAIDKATAATAAEEADAADADARARGAVLPPRKPIAGPRKTPEEADAAAKEKADAVAAAAVPQRDIFSGQMTGSMTKEPRKK